MSKIFKLIDTGLPSSSHSSQQPTVTNWKLCMICQEDNEEPLTCPLKSKRKDVGSGYSSLAENLIRFNQLGQLPFHLKGLDEGNGIEKTMITNSAQYHQSCRLKFNNTKLQRAQKRAQTKDIKEHYTQMEFTHARSKSAEKIVVRMFAFTVEILQVIVLFMKQPHSKLMNMYVLVMYSLRTQSYWLN